MKIYCGSIISGRSYEEVMEYYNYIISVLSDFGFDVLSPMLGKEALRNEIAFKKYGYGTAISSNHAIKERDQWMVTQADIVWLNFFKCKNASIGGISELAWADLLHKHTIVTMEEDNIHQHAFVLEMADIIFETEDETLDYLKKFQLYELDIRYKNHRKYD